MLRYRRSDGRGERGPGRLSAEAGWVRPLAPLVVLGVLIGMDLAGDKLYIIITAAVISPLLAAALAGPRITAVYAVGALLFGALQGIPQGYYSGTGHEGVAAQVMRLIVIGVGGVIAVMASRDRTFREARLRTVTRVADVAQRALLTTVPSRVGGMRVAVNYESAAAEARVGGDLYEVVDSPWGTRILVGDARGKGLDAVRLASRVMGTFRVVARYMADPEQVVTALDAEVAESGGPEDFVTAVFAQITGSRFGLINVGHPDPVLLHDGRARLLAAAGRRTPLGLGADGEATLSVALDVGDRLLFYTDGLAEARRPGTGDFLPLLPAVQETLREGCLDGGLKQLVARVRQWTASTLNDDVALLATEVVSIDSTPVGLTAGDARRDWERSPSPSG